MTALKATCAVAIALVAAVGIGAPPAGAALLPLGLHVEGGEESWHPKPRFTLRWSNPPGAVAAVHYRLLDPAGEVAIGATRLAWPATSIERLTVPSSPGIYTAQVWLEDRDGVQGPAASARLRFDNAEPGAVSPLPAGSWIGRTAFPYTVRLGHPPLPRPLSGIRGYAVSIDASSSGHPCAAEICAEAEIDLRGGASRDSLAIADLPEGTSHLHAAAISGAGVPSASVGSTVLRVDKTDPLTALAGLDEGWSNRPLTLRATATDAASGMAASGGAFTAIRIDGGAPATAPGNSVTATVIESGIHTVAHYARDGAGNVADGGFSNGIPNRLPATAIVKIDREPPRLAFEPAQDPLDPERIEARGSDPLSGLDQTRGSIAVRQAGSGEPFVALPTALVGSRLQARWDSVAHPPGVYEFRASAFDRAGNVAIATTRPGGSPMRLRGPLKVETKLIGTRAQSVSLLYGQETWFGGRLVAGRRTPLEGGAVQVIERFAAGAVPPMRTRTVRTGRDGVFGLRLSPGPSRQVVAVSAPTVALRSASSPPLNLSVRGRLTMRASAPLARIGGAPVVFGGKVLAAGSAIPPDGVVVQLQFRLPGLPWREFRTLRTDRRGRFRYAYRFADDDSRGARFGFRAFAPAQAGWPFEPAGSPPVAVVGR